MTRWLEDLPVGRRAQGTGGHFHLAFRSGSRAGGTSAAAAFDYVSRRDPYEDAERDPAVHTESGHMPTWATADSRTYWDAADLNERANGRLFVGADYALPRELSPEAQIDLARTFAHDLTDDERLPYTMAVHAGRNGSGQSHNPHVHLMFSERQHDGLDRTPETWFKRANRQELERGGAPKSRTFHGSAWVEQARARWAQRTNEALERAGSPTRVDHRSYARQGVDRLPSRHVGPSAHVYIGGRGQDRLDDIVAHSDETRAIADLERDIARLEVERDAIFRQGSEDRLQDTPDVVGSRDRGDDVSRGR